MNVKENLCFYSLLMFISLAHVHCKPGSENGLIQLTNSLKLLANQPENPKKTEGAESKRDPRSIYIEQKIHELINTERVKHGLKPVRLNQQLAQAALNHSTNMARVNECEHVLADGHNFLWRYHQVGFYDQVAIGNDYHLGAENIARETVEMVEELTTRDLRGRIIEVKERLVPVPLDQVAHSVVEGWMGSPGHRKNILTPYWIREGIGAAINTDPKTGIVLVYVTENFC